MDSSPLRAPRLALILALAASAIAPSARAQSPPAAAAPGEPPPNVIVVRADDQAAWALGFNGNKEIKTPNLDLVFKHGASFANSFVTTPVCSPSRAGFLMGLHGIQCGIGDFIKNSDMETGIKPEYVTLPEIFKKAGYVTGMIGKWHLGGAPKHHPLLHGYDYFMGMQEGNNEPISPTLEVFGVRRKLPGEWTTSILTDDALHFIRMNRSAPFFLVLDFRSPHYPYAPAPETESARYSADTLKVPDGVPADYAERCRKLRAEYYASISEIDRNLGRIFEFINQLKLGGSTMLVFTSDNGYMIGEHGLWHKGNATDMAKDFAGVKDPERRRPNMFEEAIRVPLAILWPGHIEPGKVVKEMVLQTDLFSSLPAMAGIAMPALPEFQKIDSRDFSPLVFGKGGEWREKIFGDFDILDGKRSRMRMVRTGDWKLVMHYDEIGGEHELYNLAKDPGELKNLYGSKSARKMQESLLKQLDEWRKSVEDPRAVE